MSTKERAKALLRSLSQPPMSERLEEVLGLNLTGDTFDSLSTTLPKAKGRDVEAIQELAEEIYPSVGDLEFRALFIGLAAIACEICETVRISRGRLPDDGRLFWVDLPCPGTWEARCETSTPPDLVLEVCSAESTHAKAEWLCCFDLALNPALLQGALASH